MYNPVNPSIIIYKWDACKGVTNAVAAARYLVVLERCHHYWNFSVKQYGGHSRINDNEFISRKVLLESVFFLLCHMRTHILPIYA